MKRIILTILMILMMAQTVLGQCVEMTSRDDITISDESPLTWTFTGEYDYTTQESDTPPTKSAYTVNAADFSWYTGCSPTSETGLFLGGQFNTHTYAVFEANYGFVKDAVYDEGIVYLYGSNTNNDFRVIKLGADGTVEAAKTYTASNNIIGLSITTTADGSEIYVGGYRAVSNNDALLVKLDENLDVVWSYTYDFADYDRFLDLKYDENGYVAVTGRTEMVEFMKWLILTTVDITDGDLIDYEKVYSDEAETEYEAQMVLKQNLGDDTDWYYAADDSLGLCDTILYGHTTIADDTGIIAVSDYINLLDCTETGSSGETTLEYLTLSSTSKMDMTVTVEIIQDPHEFYGGIVRIDTDGTIETARMLDALDSWVNKQIEQNDGTAYFTSFPDLIVKFETGGTFDAWSVDGDVPIYPAFMTYGNNKFFVNYNDEDSVVGIMTTAADMSDVDAAYDISDPITMTGLSLEYNSVNNWLFYSSNNGGGFQGFGITSPVSGPVPEFSITTLLLATLLAGGLVLFVVRRRK